MEDGRCFLDFFNIFPDVELKQGMMRPNGEILYVKIKGWRNRRIVFLNVKRRFDPLLTPYFGPFFML